MLEIKKEYGSYSIIKDGVTLSEFKTINELYDYAENNKLYGETVKSSMYVFDEDTILESTDLLMVTILRAWENLYAGDSLKVEINVSYEAENK